MNNRSAFWVPMIAACFSLWACAKPSAEAPHSTAQPIEFRVVEVQSKKSEKFWDYNKSTDITYETTGALEVVPENAKTDPMVVYLERIDRSGFDEDGSQPTYDSVPVFEGRGEFSFSRQRSIKAGQVYPPAPRYDWAVVGALKFENARQLRSDSKSASDAAKVDLTHAFELRISPLSVQEEDNRFDDSKKTYYGELRGIVRVLDPKLKSTPLIVSLMIKARKHGDPQKVGKTTWTIAIVSDGEGTFATTEYFGDASPTAIPEYEVTLFGFQIMEPARLATPNSARQPALASLGGAVDWRGRARSNRSRDFWMQTRLALTRPPIVNRADNHHRRLSGG